MGQTLVTTNRVYILAGSTSDIASGVTDAVYTALINGTETPVITDGSGFFIPDYSSQETETEKYYIKY